MSSAVFSQAKFTVLEKNKRSANNEAVYAIEKYVESQEKGEHSHDEGV